MSLLVDNELDFAGWFVVTFFSEHLRYSISAERFSCVARAEYSFLLFSFSCEMDLGELLCELRRVRESAHMGLLADARQTRLCLDPPSELREPIRATPSPP